MQPAPIVGAIHESPVFGAALTESCRGRRWPPLYAGRHTGRPLRFCSTRASVPPAPPSRASPLPGRPQGSPLRFCSGRAVGAGLAPARSTFPGLPSSRATARVASTLLFRSGCRGGPAWPPAYLFRPGRRGGPAWPPVYLFRLAVGAALRGRPRICSAGP